MKEKTEEDTALCVSGAYPRYRSTATADTVYIASQSLRGKGTGQAKYSHYTNKTAPLPSPSLVYLFFAICRRRKATRSPTLTSSSEREGLRTFRPLSPAPPLTITNQ